MDSVCIETPAVSYLQQRTSSHLVTAAHQLLTQKRWDKEQFEYDLVVSQYAIDEISAGERTCRLERNQR